VIRPVLAFAALGWREAAAEWPAVLGRSLVFALPILIFAAIWHATPLAALTLPRHDVPHLIWYVATTEIIVFAMAFPYRGIEDDIRLGRIEAGMTRPVPYTLAALAENFGAATFRFVVLGAIGVGLGLALTGIAPVRPEALPALALGALLGCLMGVVFQVMVGLSAVWFDQAAPLFWIWQKAMFVLGGLLLPLSLYPEAVAAVAHWTPFPAMLNLPAGLVLGDADGAIAACVALQLGWSAVLLAALAAVDRAAMRRLARDGV